MHCRIMFYGESPWPCIFTISKYMSDTTMWHHVQYLHALFIAQNADLLFRRYCNLISVL